MVSETLMWKEGTKLPHVHGPSRESREAKPQLEPLSQFSISPPNLEVPGHFLDFSLSPSDCSGSDWRLLGSPSYSEASDSWERYFSEISVTLITGPLRFFFFREGVLERPDLEAATGTQRVVEGRGWRIESHIHEAFGATVPHTLCVPFWVSGDLLVLHRDCTALTTVAEGWSILREEDMA